MEIRIRDASDDGSGCNRWQASPLFRLMSKAISGHSLWVTKKVGGEEA